LMSAPTSSEAAHGCLYLKRVCKTLELFAAQCSHQLIQTCHGC
jgi:hypothetical protein